MLKYVAILWVHESAEVFPYNILVLGWAKFRCASFKRMAFRTVLQDAMMVIFSTQLVEINTDSGREWC